MRTLLWAATAFSMLFSGSAGSKAYAQKVPIILDTDIGTDIDDAFALALALASPEIELRGVTTVSADAYGRALIACRMLHYAGRGEVPVAPGRPRRERPEQKGQYQYGLEAGVPNRPLPEPALSSCTRSSKPSRAK
jgi:inosine-uridine nucleoside N-ribohydrolase